MSRYSDDGYDEEFPNQGAFWQANAERALKGRRGRRALADLRDALRALPQKRLIEGALCTVNPEKRVEPPREGYDWYRDQFLEEVQRQGEGVCAIGAYVWWQKVKAGCDPAEAFDALPTLHDEDGWSLHDTADLGKEAGLVYSLAWELAYRNDEVYRHDMTPDGKWRALTAEERYDRFMAWLDHELTEPAVAGKS